MNSSKRRLRFQPPIVTLLLLAGLVVTRPANPGVPPEAEAYHARIRKLVAAVPYRIEDWVGVDVAVPEAATRMLHPNVILSRRYRQLETGRTVSFLLVHCRDSRDILGHYPPVCFVSQGWTLREKSEQAWTVLSRELIGMRYEFAKDRIDRPMAATVDNLLLVPDGTLALDMSAVSHAAQDQRLRHFGATQIQVVYETAMSDQDREACFQAFVGTNLALIEALLEGGQGDDE